MDTNYLPILKARRGELKALSQLNASTKGNVIPLIDIPRADLDKENGTENTNLESHIVKKATNIRSSWGNNFLFYIDLHDFDLSKRLSDGTHPMNYLMNYLRNLGLKAIPTTDLARDESYNFALAKEIAKDQRGYLIRIYEEDMINTNELHTNLRNILKVLRQNPEDTHVLLYFESILGRDPYEIASITMDIINELPSVTSCRSLSMAASGMPQTLSEKVKPGEKGIIKRTEFEAFKTVLLNGNKLKRTPNFGDYAIVHPTHRPYKQQAISIAPSIRYTTSEEWLILRGVSTKKHPKKMGQYHELSEELIKHPEFQGSNFCYGDREITKISNNIGSPRIPNIWVGIGCNHHMTYIVQQLKNPH